MDPAETVRIRDARAEHAAGLSDLFSRSGVACHCRYWHFQGDTNSWLDRLAHASERNRAEMIAAIECGSPEMTGVIALEDHRVVGWLKLAPVKSLQKLYTQRLYRNLPCFSGQRDGIVTIGCVFVEPDHRRRGIARALLQGAVDSARASGARAVEALPRRADDVNDAELWMGPYRIFLDAGFAIVHDFAPYPVLRLTL
jgi:GNAT superfamily N-acetyltransferase